MDKLSSGKCVPCEGGISPATGKELQRLLAQLEAEAPGWSVIDGRILKKKFSFKDFREALEFVNKIGGIAEKEGHHPDIKFGWGYVEVMVWTHKINGLTESDFVLSSKIG